MKVRNGITNQKNLINSCILSFMQPFNHCYRKGWHKILKYLSLPIARSTWILTWDKALDVSISLCDSWSFPLVNGGLARAAPRNVRSSDISDPQLPRTKSPGTKWWRNPLWAVRCLFETRPPQHLETKITAPVGLIATRYFTVLCPL